jgi:hypothetical protein
MSPPLAESRNTNKEEEREREREERRDRDGECSDVFRCCGCCSIDTDDIINISNIDRERSPTGPFALAMVVSRRGVFGRDCHRAADADHAAASSACLAETSRRACRYSSGVGATFIERFVVRRDLCSDASRSTTTSEVADAREARRRCRSCWRSRARRRPLCRPRESQSSESRIC